MKKEKDNRKKQAQILRLFRKVHRVTGILLFAFFFFVAITSILLGWKKHSGGYLMPQTEQGTSTDFKRWLSLDSLTTIANTVTKDNFPSESNEIDKIEVRKPNGLVKFTYKDHYGEIQLDGATGKTLSVGTRASDFLEQVHDGSILDRIFGTGNGIIKVIYSSIMGLGLLIFTITGFWLWYGPKKMKKNSKSPNR